MEKDINTIVDVDEGEANLLVTLIKQHFEDWHITRHDRKIRLETIKDMAAKKEAQRKGEKISSSN